MERQEEENRKSNEYSDNPKTNKPDFIQTIAMNLTQSQSNPKLNENPYTKRKNPFSQILKTKDENYRPGISH
jgi:hypothetical protein